MKSAVFTAVVVSAGLLAAAGTAAAQGNEDACKAVLQKELPALLNPNNTSGFCNLLAGAIYTDRSKVAIDKVLSTGTVRVGDVFSQRDVQNRVAQPAATGGTPAQGQALPSVQPAGVAAGTIAAVGTRSGQDAIAALTLNPAVLAFADAASRGLARASRFADITVFLPMSGAAQPEGAAAGANKLRYVGARVRLNFTGLSSGDEVWQGAERLLKAQIVQSAVFVSQLAKVLSRVTDVQKCVDALKPSAAPVSGDPPCEALDTRWALDEAVAAKLHDELAVVRRKADSKYFGADIRMDFGDPTLGDVEHASGKFLFAGLSAGRRLDDGTGRAVAGFRGRLGVRHAKLDTDSQAEFAIEGGVGMELSRSLSDDEEVSVSGAVEFRRGNADANATDRFQTNFTMLRGSISLPIAKGNSLSINVGKPISGDVSPIFSVNFNWGLLLSQALGR